MRNPQAAVVHDLVVAIGQHARIVECPDQGIVIPGLGGYHAEAPGRGAHVHEFGQAQGVVESLVQARRRYFMFHEGRNGTRHAYRQGGRGRVKRKFVPCRLVMIENFHRSPFTVLQVAAKNGAKDNTFPSACQKE